EMVATGELLTRCPSVRAKARVDLGLIGGSLTSVQLAGREAAPMAAAARMVADLGAPIIDINMGCPAKKVTGGLSGSALMRDLDHALRLIEAVVTATDVPVTLKCRLGWDGDCLNAATLATRAEAAGIRMIAVHGRTRQQFYTGRADWAAVAAVRQAVRIPVIVNGDIRDVASAREALAQSGADAVMVGRGAQGAPWLTGAIAAEIDGTPAPAIPVGGALADVVAAHYEDMLSFYGSVVGLRVARKHLGWYADAAGVAAEGRRRLLTAAEPDVVLRALPEVFADRPLMAAA